MNLGRRSFLVGLIAAPVVVRSGLLMPVKPAFDAEAWRAMLLRVAQLSVNPPLVADWQVIAESFYPKPGDIVWIDANTRFAEILLPRLAPPEPRWLNLA